MSVTADLHDDVMDPSEDPNAPEHLSDEELLYELLEAPNLNILKNIRLLADGYQFGHPLAVTAKAIIVSAMSVPETTFDTGAGPVPLNFQFGFVGASGRGKGRAMGSPIEAANGVDWVKKTPASGEALIDLFYEVVPDDNDKPVAVLHGKGVCAKWNEVDTYAAKSGRSNGAKSGTGSTATMDSTIRSLISGEEVGDTALSRGASVGAFLEALSYRFCVWLGVQPTRAHPLIADGGGGTLQRTIWVLTRSGNKPRKAAEIRAVRDELARRLRLTTTPDKAPTIHVWGPSEVDVQQHIKDRVMELMDLVLTGSEAIDDDDTHAVNWTIRLAGIFAGWVAAERNNSTATSGNPYGSAPTFGGVNVSPVAVVDDEAWRWGECFMEMSRRARYSIHDSARKAKTKELHESGWDDGERLVSKNNRLELEKRFETTKTLQRIITVLKTKGNMSERDMRKDNLTKKQGANYYDAIDMGFEAGCLVVVDGAKGSKIIQLLNDGVMA